MPTVRTAGFVLELPESTRALGRVATPTLGTGEIRRVCAFDTAELPGCHPKRRRSLRFLPLRIGLPAHAIILQASDLALDCSPIS